MTNQNLDHDGAPAPVRPNIKGEPVDKVLTRRSFAALSAAILVAGCGKVSGDASGSCDAGSVSIHFDSNSTPAPAPAPAPVPAPAPAVPTIAVASRKNELLQMGDFFIEDDNWGANGLVEGLASTQYEQAVGVSSILGSQGEAAFRAKWRWPSGFSEVKGFPCIETGRRPGYYNVGPTPGGKQVRLPNGSISQASPSGATPGAIFPIQLPAPSLKAKFRTKHLTLPTGQGQLTFDMWLQSSPAQDTGFLRSSISHEIMISLESWGGYGTYPVERNPFWYDHDAVIDGRKWHVYATKTNNPGGANHEALLYNFGRLDGVYGRAVWKMIAFVPDVFPVPAGSINLAAFVNYIATRADKYGNRRGNGNEHLVGVELGVEPVVGTGDLVVYDYLVSR